MTPSARSWKRALLLALAVLLAFGVGWWISTQVGTLQVEPAPPPALAAATTAVEPIAQPAPAAVDPPRKAVAATEPAATPPSAPATHASYSLRVRVADPRGAPVCGASVELLLKNPDSVTERASVRPQAIAMTGQDGVAARELTLLDLTRGPMEEAPAGMRIEVPKVEPVPAGFTRVALSAKRPGYGDVRKEFLLDLAVQAQELALEMDRGLVLYGKVHYEGGTPVERATVGLGLVTARTDALGQIVASEMCEGVRVLSPGVAGWAPGQELGIVIVSPKPEYEDHRSLIVFDQSNLDLDLVLRRTQRLRLTIVDCATGEPIHARKLTLVPWKHDPDKPVYAGIGERAETAGVLKDVEIFLRSRESTHMAIVVENCVGIPIALPVVPDERIGTEALPVQACVRRLKPVALSAKSTDGSSVGTFDVQVTVNRLSAPWGTNYRIRAGEVLDASAILANSQRAAKQPVTAIESVEITWIQCVAPDLRTGTLTDTEGTVLTLPVTGPGGGGTLANPISLLAGAWPAAEPVPLETLSFVIVPFGK